MHNSNSVVACTRAALVSSIIIVAGVLSAHAGAGSDSVDAATFLCRALSKASKVAVQAKDPQTAKNLAQASNNLDRNWAEVFADSGIRPEDFDKYVRSDELAAMMADVNSGTAPPRTTAPSKPKDAWTPFDIARTSLSVAGIADPVGATSVVAAYLYPKCSTPDAQRGKGTFCWKDSNVRGVGIIPKGCDAAHPDYDAGLCYHACPSGMKGVGPVCWTTAKVSHPRGVGVLPTACPADHPDRDAGLCYRACPHGYKGVGPVCWKGLKAHGRGVGIVPRACDRSHPDYDAGLCYHACPRGMKGVGPVCWTTAKVSHPRGVGVIPTGCPPSHPDYDAGLCYQKCGSGRGVGPVCWATCSGKFPVACGAGCATNKAECGFATTDMVSSPLEMAANIISLGTASSETVALRASRKAAEKAAKKAAADAAARTAKEAAEKAARKAAEATAKQTTKKAAELGLGVADDLTETLMKMGSESAEVSEAASKTLARRMKQGIENSVSKKWAQAKAVHAKSGELRAKLKKFLPKNYTANKFANALERNATIARYMRKLEKIHDALHVKEVRAAEKMITRCASAGYQVTKAAMGVQ